MSQRKERQKKKLQHKEKKEGEQRITKAANSAPLWSYQRRQKVSVRLPQQKHTHCPNDPIACVYIVLYLNPKSGVEELSESCITFALTFIVPFSSPEKRN